MSTRHAFTLLELMVAVAISAMVAAILVGSLQSTFRLKEGTESSAETPRTAGLVMEMLRSDIQASLPPSRGTFQQAFEVAFNPRGDGSDDLRFFTTAPVQAHLVSGVSAADGDIKQIEITAYQPAGSTDRVLVRRTWNNLLDPNLVQYRQQNPTQPPPVQLGDEEVLCRHVAGLTFDVYDSNTNAWVTAGSAGVTTWDSTNSTPANVLPRAVRVNLQLQSPQKQRNGSPVIESYSQVFLLPCNGASNDPTTSATAGSATGGTK